MAFAFTGITRRSGTATTGSNSAPSSLAKNSSVPSDFRCLDLVNQTDFAIGCRFASWLIHSEL